MAVVSRLGCVRTPLPLSLLHGHSRNANADCQECYHAGGHQCPWRRLRGRGVLTHPKRETTAICYAAAKHSPKTVIWRSKTRGDASGAGPGGPGSGFPPGDVFIKSKRTTAPNPMPEGKCPGKEASPATARAARKQGLH